MRGGPGSQPGRLAPFLDSSSRLCNDIQENGKLVKMGSFSSSLICQVRELRYKAQGREK